MFNFWEIFDSESLYDNSEDITIDFKIFEYFWVSIYYELMILLVFYYISVFIKKFFYFCLLSIGKYYIML